MSRTSGSFPSYTKLEIDPDIWPVNFWDQSLKCIRCDALWPNDDNFNVSPCCGAATRPVDNVPDMRWPDAIKALHTARFEKLYTEWNEGLTDEQLVIDEFLTTLTEEKELVLQGNK